ncbi:cupin-like domain-containing protein [Bremerella cremea]|uniref:cupin-like domain-containing protein n=1 Tax=Bremerella cremea TaxID=1031537 RepID=UPI0031E9D1CA
MSVATSLVDCTFTNQQLEDRPLTVQHHLLETGLFDDEHLIRVLDTHPRDYLNVHTMGTDENRNEWQEGDASKLSGEQLWEATQAGRLWLNVRNMAQHHTDYRNVINDLYDELESKVPGFNALERSANLLISSPRALVYYHLDIPCNMLWHMRGVKRVWAYPPRDDRYVTQQKVEDVICGICNEELDYQPEFDAEAMVVDLQPGQMVTWPQNTPHRVSNLEGLNVSLTTEHLTPKARRRIKLFRANRFLRHTMGCRHLSQNTEGLGYRMKVSSYAFVRAWEKMFPKKAEGYHYPVTFKLDPSHPAKMEEMAK